MESDPNRYITVLAGIDTFPGADRGGPFFNLRWNLVKWAKRREIHTQWAHAEALLRCTAQGYPNGQKGVDSEAVSELVSHATAAVNGYGQALMPWVDWDADNDADNHDLETAMPALIKAWQLYYEGDEDEE